jgi:Fe2+ transport protein
MKLVRLAVLPTLLLVSAACVAAPGAGTPSTAPGVVASPVASPSPVAASLLGTPAAAGGPGALPPASVEVSPGQLQSGTLTLSLSVERARHMLDQATALSTDPDPAHQTAANAANSTGSTALVLAEMLKLTNNYTAAQPIPDDEPQFMVRHVDLQIRSGGGEAIPYLSASLDVLLDGHPVIANIPLVPMVAGDATPPQLYYGNNVRLIQRGTYQMFARVQPNPLLAKNAPPTAQFTVTVH